MAKALLIVTGELFAQVLRLPDGTTVTPRDVTVVVDHPDIPDGTKTVTPLFVREGQSQDVRFVSWNAQ